MGGTSRVVDDGEGCSQLWSPALVVRYALE